MVAADDDADGAVRAIVGIAKGIVFVLVRFEAEFIKTMFQTFMKRYGIGAKRDYLSLAIDLKVEMLAGEIIVVVRVMVLQTVCLLIPSSTFRLIAFGSGEGFGGRSYMDGCTCLLFCEFAHFGSF
jgi:hypothetical protein